LTDLGLCKKNKEKFQLDMTLKQIKEPVQTIPEIISLFRGKS